MKLVLPDALRDQLRSTFTRHLANWLVGGGDWPLTLNLGQVTEKDMAVHMGAVRQWATEWGRWPGPGEVSLEARHWPALGTQQLPARLTLCSPLDVARAIGSCAYWTHSAAALTRLAAHWPHLAQRIELAKLAITLVDWNEAELDKLLAVVDWLLAHPQSGLFLRQLPVEGIDTKWIETRKGAVATLLQLTRPTPEPVTDFHALCGLRKAPTRMRVRVLCPELRQHLAGLGDLELPLEQLAQLNWQPSAVVVVENLETGLALPDLPGTVALMKLGNAVSLLAELPWLQHCPVFYWGDLDTHGLAILARARLAVPQLQSLLMNEATLLAWRDYWSEEKTPAPVQDLASLTEAEQAVYQGLNHHRWGRRVRLEQERIPWAVAEAVVRMAVTPWRAPEPAPQSAEPVPSDTNPVGREPPRMADLCPAT